MAHFKRNQRPPLKRGPCPKIWEKNKCVKIIIRENIVQEVLSIEPVEVDDEVLYQGQECFVWGCRSSGSFLLKHLDGTKVKDGVGYKYLK